MARKQAPHIPIQKQLSPAEMSSAIKKIERRLADLKNFDIELIERADDANLVALEHKIDQLLLDTFGAESAQYASYGEIKNLYSPGSLNIFQGSSVREIRDEVKRGITRATTVLESIKQGFNEEIDDADDDITSRVIKAYRGLNLHSVVAEAASKRYLDGYYADAVESAIKALNNYVRLKSKVTDLDGVKLMERVFSSQNPILKFNNLINQSDRDEQKGLMLCFCGAVMGLRNPRAHDLVEDKPEDALESIAFISWLAKQVDKSFI